MASATPQPGPAPPSLDDVQGLPGAVWARIALALGLGVAAVAVSILVPTALRPLRVVVAE